MIVKLCMQLLVSLISLLLSGVQALGLSQDVLDVLADVYDALDQGASVIACYTHFSYLCTLLSIVISVKACLGAYHFVMWVARKIPYWGVRE